MIVIDTNILVYAHRQFVPEHESAKRIIETAASNPKGWGISLPSICIRSTNRVDDIAKFIADKRAHERTSKT